MTRKLFPSLLFLFVLALPLSAAGRVVPLSLRDAGAVSATNGDSTLVVWTNRFSVYQQVWHVYMRLLDSPHDRNAIHIGRGSAPRVATNGRQYLIGYSYSASRFGASMPYDNTFLQLVSPQGFKIGPPRVLSRSLSGSIRGVVWNGTHWLVAYDSGAPTPGSQVVFLDEALNRVATVPIESGSSVTFANIGERWWAIYENFARSTDAVEVRPDGTAGMRFRSETLPGTASFVHLTRGPQPLLLFQNGERVDALPFDPAKGFAVRHTFLEDTLVLDGEPFEDGSLLLVADDVGYETIFVNAANEPATPLLLFSATRRSGSDTIGPSKDGLLLFVTPSISIDDGDLFAYRIPPSRAAIDPATGRLVSQITIGSSRQRGARH